MHDSRWKQLPNVESHSDKPSQCCAVAARSQLSVSTRRVGPDVWIMGTHHSDVTGCFHRLFSDYSFISDYGKQCSQGSGEEVLPFRAILCVSSFEYLRDTQRHSGAQEYQWMSWDLGMQPCICTLHALKSTLLFHNLALEHCIAI